MGERIGFGPRLGAALIDLIVILVAGFVLGAVFAAGAAGGGYEEALGVGRFLNAMIVAILGTQILSLIWIVWEGITGAALGKMLLKIRIKSDDGAKGTPDKLFLRAAVKYSASILGLLGALTGQ